MPDATITAQLALLGWLPLSVLVFRIARPSIAIPLLMIAPAMFLPEDTVFEMKGLPDLDKHTIGVGCVAFNLLFRRVTLIALRPELRVPAGFFALLVGGAVLTAATNLDPLPILGEKALRPYDGLSMAADDVLRIGFPFLIGCVTVRSIGALRTMLMVLAAAGVGYSLLALYEARMSPQLHAMVYGMHQNEVSKSYRLGGFRPMVFMQTGLALAIFMLSTVMAAATLARSRMNVFRLPGIFVFAYLVVVLVLCRSLGTLVYAAAFLPILFLPRQKLSLALILLALGTGSYPLLRATNVMPTEAIVSSAERVSPDRAQSLGFRFRNEDVLLRKALQRPLFGWGGFGRNRVFDPSTLRDLTITDGFWIIQFGQRGWVGLVAILGLILIPVVRAARLASRLPDKGDAALLSGLALIVVVRFVDMLPNGWYDVHVMFFAGVLTGLAYELDHAQAFEFEPSEETQAERTASGVQPELAPTRS